MELTVATTDVLEKMFLDSAGQRKPHLAFLDMDTEDLSNGLPFSRLASALQSPRLNGHQSSPAARGYSPEDPVSLADSPRKRRRVDDGGDSFWATGDDSSWVPQLPPLPLLEAVVEAHFRTVHHWVPILHETRFRAKLKDVQERSRLAVLFHALLSSGIKYIDFENLGMSLQDVERQIRISRKVVVLNAMDSLSVEHIQALIFLAFDYVRIW